MTALRRRLLEDMQLRQLSPFTQRAYVASIAQFARHVGRSPADVGPEEIRAYQVYLTTERGLAPSSVDVAVSALRFLYRVTLQRRWLVDEVMPLPKKPRPLMMGDNAVLGATLGATVYIRMIQPLPNQ